MANALLDLDRQALISYRDARADLDSLRLDKLNLVREVQITWPQAAEVPRTHLCREFYGAAKPVSLSAAAWAAQSAGDKAVNVNLTDDIAPIGSTYRQLEITTAAVSGARVWVKKAADTWFDMTPDPVPPG